MESLLFLDKYKEFFQESIRNCFLERQKLISQVSIRIFSIDKKSVFSSECTKSFFAQNVDFLEGRRKYEKYFFKLKKIFGGRFVQWARSVSFRRLELEILLLFMQAFLFLENIMVSFLINMEILLISFDIFFFITLHVGFSNLFKMKLNH